METLILYATKYGAAEEIAKRISGSNIRLTAWIRMIENGDVNVPLLNTTQIHIDAIVEAVLACD